MIPLLSCSFVMNARMLDSDTSFETDDVAMIDEPPQVPRGRVRCTLTMSLITVLVISVMFVYSVWEYKVLSPRSLSLEVICSSGHCRYASATGVESEPRYFMEEARDDYIFSAEEFTLNACATVRMGCDVGIRQGKCVLTSKRYPVVYAREEVVSAAGEPVVSWKAWVDSRCFLDACSKMKAMISDAGGKTVDRQVIVYLAMMLSVYVLLFMWIPTCKAGVFSNYYQEMVY
ncbi:hypothetical protein [Eastern grey kangaroopox virus]|uniref:Uncharacterized protein n=1 Tax=Eastern grey kangaroopox virus TaxID=2042482 RepID=A0A2C9DSY3_9POXV|nr:hypothetical protein KM541_gp020 [Eastern grey kangaroopox virus]ATI21116.1 hypothetical protein [Eastern grey kangaroopox virus]ATX75019.1 hypothetical protein EKPV-NSW-ORF032 [Eastern grey kangaroopox virus]